MYYSWKGIPRPALLALSQLVMVGGYAFLAVGIEGSLFVGSIVVGICYGVRLAVSVPTVSELFGLKIFGLMYNVLILNLPLGSFLFSSLLAGFLYDLEAAKQAAEDDDDQASSTLCSGVHCYRTVFIVMAAVSMLGFFLDVLLTLRTRKLYASIRRDKLAAAQTIS
jgi:MFS family permease